MATAEPVRGESWVPEHTFGDRLVVLRRHLKLNSEEIALRCGLNRATWNTWEHGASPRNMAEVVEKIHRGTGADREWVMWGSSPSTPSSAWFTADELRCGTGADRIKKEAA